MSNYVVYVIDEARAKPTGEFLAIEETYAEAESAMETWWEAFENGEKKEPIDYGGVSFGKVADFDEWVSPEEYDG